MSIQDPRTSDVSQDAAESAAFPKLSLHQKQRQLLLWRLLLASFGQNEQAQNIESMSFTTCEGVKLPAKDILDPSIGIEQLLRFHPKLAPEIDALVPTEEENDEESGESASKAEQGTTQLSENTESVSLPRPYPMDDQRIRRTLLFSKLILNTLGPNTQAPSISAAAYTQWLQDLQYFERAFGYAPGELMGGRQVGGAGTRGGGGGSQGAGQQIVGGQQGSLDPGHPGFQISEEQLRDGLRLIETGLVQRMELREVLNNPKLASKLNPSMALTEQLLRDKDNLSGVALQQAKRLIQRFVDQLAEVLRLQVAQSVRSKIDRSVPPKRVFRNLDLKRTLWKNLTNWNEEEGRLYVDRLFYRQSAKKTLPTRLIVVVDQSGSMVQAMVQCTILASIFAGLPNVDVHLLAFDTEVIDLTPYVHDPFDVLLRTQLGGGTYIYKSLVVAAQKIVEPANTVMVLISDFYEGGNYETLLSYIKSLKDSGVHFLPVGAITGGGFYSVDNWFRTRLAELGMPILSGSPKKLIEELKNLL